MTHQPDLYEVLGVARDASITAIRAAYRAKSKILHPDAETGDEEAFRLLKLAEQVLSNPERRKKYDETGDNGEPEDIRTLVTRMVIQVVNNAIGSAEGTRNPFTFDIISLAKSEMRQIIREMERGSKKNLKDREYIQNMANRFKTTEPENVVERMLLKNLEVFEAAVKNNETQLRAAKEAMRVLDTYTFTQDKVLGGMSWQESQVGTMMGGFGHGTF